MKEVFISYSTADKALAEQLSLELDQLGVTFWRDEIQIGWGELINEKVAKGVSEANFVVVIITDNSMRSEWVRKEVNIALHREAQDGKNTLLPYVLCAPDGVFERFPDIKVKKYLDSSIPFNVAALQIKELLVGPVSDSFIYNFPSSYTGPIWIRAAGENLAAATEHRFEISWGPWYREFSFEIKPKTDIYFRLSKQDNLALPMRLNADPPCRISFGLGKAPGANSIDINPFWVDAKARFARLFARLFLWPK